LDCGRRPAFGRADFELPAAAVAAAERPCGRRDELLPLVIEIDRRGGVIVAVARDAARSAWPAAVWPSGARVGGAQSVNGAGLLGRR